MQLLLLGLGVGLGVATAAGCLTGWAGIACVIILLALAAEDHADMELN